MEIDYGIKKWKYFGYVIGCIGIAITILLSKDFIADIEDQNNFLLLSINLVVSIVWFVGVFLSKPYLLVPLLLWFTFIFGTWMIFVVIYVMMRIEESNDSKVAHDDDDWIFDIVMLVITVILVFVYTLTVICYVRFRRATKRCRSEIPRMDVEYTPAPTKNQLYPNID